jgi:hypothetical protein
MTRRASTSLAILLVGASAAGPLVGAGAKEPRRSTAAGAVTYVGAAVQPSADSRAPYASPGLTFRLSASGRTITRFTTTRPPRPTMYSATCGLRPADQPCQVFGYSINATADGFPAPVIHVAADGTFSGRTTDLYARTTIIRGHLDRRRATATGTILLDSLSTPSNPLSPVYATFTAHARR